jgi:2-isopropylmalate synthase
MVEQSVAHLRRSGRRVIFDAEHFFDGYEEDADYALRVLKAAREGGAERLVLCDTNGGHLPWRVEEIVRRAAGEIETPLGIHAHNDSGCAVANSLAAVRAGATHVQGTINGIGERCGNADLCATIADLELKLDRRCLPEGGLGRLTDLARRVAEIVNAAPPGAAPYVGRSAFAHKGGVHVAAIRRDPGAYEHVDPAVVGNETRVLVSELSGRGNLRSFADRIGVEIENASAGEMLGRIKELERDGFAFEAAPATVELMLRREGKDYRPFFELIDFHVVVEHRAGRGHLAEANVKVSVGGDVMHTAAEGPGPVAALDAALRKALAERYPVIDRFEIADYKVRTLDADRGAASGVRVLVDTSDGDARWSTVGASRNIIEASWRALFDGYEYGLLQASEGRWPAERASAAAQAG